MIVDAATETRRHWPAQISEDRSRLTGRPESNPGEANVGRLAGRGRLESNMNMPARRSASDQLRTAIRRAERDGMTQSQIADAAGVPRSTITRFMSGERGIGLELAERVAKAIGKRLKLQD